MARNLLGWREVLAGFSTVFNPRRTSLHFSASRGIQLDLSRPHPLHEKFSPSRGIYRLKLLIKIIFPPYFQEIKFLLESRHFHIPREVLPISPHLVGFILSRPHPLHEKFSPSCGIPRDEEKFSWMGWDMGSEQDRARLGSTSSLKRDGGVGAPKHDPLNYRLRNQKGAPLPGAPKHSQLDN